MTPQLQAWHGRQMKTAIYSLRDPRTGMTRYIGKTIRPLRIRLSQHLSSARRGEDTHRARWTRELFGLGMEPRIDLIEMVEGDGCLEEIGHIAMMRRAGYKLVNSTDGGDGLRSGAHSPEVIEKMRIASTGRKHSSETIELRASKMRGRKYTDEHRANIAKSKIGHRWTDEQKEMLSRAHKGVSVAQLFTPEAIAKSRANVPRGERHRAAKITASQAQEIRESEELQSVLAKRYGVGPDQISRIRSGKSWRIDIAR